MYTMFLTYLTVVLVAAFAHGATSGGEVQSGFYFMVLLLPFALLCGAEAELIFGKRRKDTVKASLRSKAINRRDCLLTGVAMGGLTSLVCWTLATMLRSREASGAIAWTASDWKSWALVAGIAVAMSIGPLGGWVWLIRVAGRRGDASLST